ncbi:hypothetical protein CRUP_023679 [Coryphaenoides rupestris]|nr:hypothetical protein CRUP_023679 [Coryphaenoides rupestris]
MAPRSLAPLAKRLMRGVILLEMLGVFGAYGLFYKMNTSQVYYRSNEWAGVYGVREGDHQDWSGRSD